MAYQHLLSPPGESLKQFPLSILDDGVFEGDEVLVLELTDPVGVVIEQPSATVVTIHDPEDGKHGIWVGLESVCVWGAGGGG